MTQYVTPAKDNRVCHKTLLAFITNIQMIWQNSWSHFWQKFLPALSTLPFSFHPSPWLHFSSLNLTFIRTRTFSASPLKRVIAISTHGCCYDHKIKPEFAAALYAEGEPEKLDLVAVCTLLTCIILHCFQQIYTRGFMCIRTSLHLGNLLLTGDEDVVCETVECIQKARLINDCSILADR